MSTQRAAFPGGTFVICHPAPVSQHQGGPWASTPRRAGLGWLRSPVPASWASAWPRSPPVRFVPHPGDAANPAEGLQEVPAGGRCWPPADLRLRLVVTGVTPSCAVGPEPRTEDSSSVPYICPKPAWGLPRQGRSPSFWEAGPPHGLPGAPPPTGRPWGLQSPGTPHPATWRALPPSPHPGVFPSWVCPDSLPVGGDPKLVSGDTALPAPPSCAGLGSPWRGGC